MNGKIALITVLTDNVPTLVQFYQDVLGFEVKSQNGDYVEFHNEDVRFAVCSRTIMSEATSHSLYNESKSDLPPLFVPPLKLEFVFKQTVGA
jgi:lactoylglutathione lyase